MKYDVIEEIGKTFGDQLANLFSSVRTFLVTVASVDNGIANVFIYDEGDTFPVPCALFAGEGYEISATPTVGSVATITYIDGDLNRPVFVNMSQIDAMSFRRSATSVSVSINPDDATKDVVSVVVGNSSASFSHDLIEMNEGGLGGLVVVGKLTERLNKLQSEIDSIQSSINSHTHNYIDSVGSAATPTPKITTGTNYARVRLTQVKDEDYVNDKITQG